MIYVEIIDIGNRNRLIFKLKVTYKERNSNVKNNYPPAKRHQHHTRTTSVCLLLSLESYHFSEQQLTI